MSSIPRDDELATLLQPKAPSSGLKIIVSKRIFRSIAFCFTGDEYAGSRLARAVATMSIRQNGSPWDLPR